MFHHVLCTPQAVPGRPQCLGTTTSTLFWYGFHNLLAQTWPTGATSGWLPGEFTSELDAGDHVVEFSSAGPKNNGYLTRAGKVECKVCGFSLNTRGQQQLNFNVLKSNIFEEVQERCNKAQEIPVWNPHKTVRDVDTKQLRTQTEIKMVTDKRAVDTTTFRTYPYGFSQEVSTTTTEVQSRTERLLDEFLLWGLHLNKNFCWRCRGSDSPPHQQKDTHKKWKPLFFFFWNARLQWVKMVPSRCSHLFFFWVAYTRVQLRAGDREPIVYDYNNNNLYNKKHACTTLKVFTMKQSVVLCTIKKKGLTMKLLCYVQLKKTIDHETVVLCIILKKKYLLLKKAQFVRA